MKLITHFLLAAFAFSLMAGCTSEAHKGDGEVVTEQRSIPDFSAVQVKGVYDVTWVQSEPNLSIETDKNLQALVSTSVRDGTLYIENKEPLKPSKSIQVSISSRALKEVMLDGVAKFYARKLEGESLKLIADGATSFTLDGVVKSVNVRLVGASRLNAESLQADKATVSVDGAANAKLYVKEELDATVTGAGVLNYLGKPKSVKQRISGVGRIEAQ